MEGLLLMGTKLTTHYIDCNENYYDPVRNTVVLDEKLKDYPLAHRYVKRHELQHAKFRMNPIKNLIHELKTDYELTVRKDETMEEIKEYRSRCRKPLLKHIKHFLISGFVNISRMIIGSVLTPISYLYSIVKRMRGDRSD